MNESGELIKPNEQKITEVKTIEESVIHFKNRAEIAQYVETPLVSACEHFWDLGIQTLMSSANSTDVGYNAYIDLDYDSLSEENKKIAEELSGEKFLMHGIKPTLTIKIITSPIITTETTIEEITKKADEVANRFKKQKATWIPTWTLEELREIYMDMDSILQPSDFAETRFYDKENKLFYMSKEHYDKLRETVI